MSDTRKDNAFTRFFNESTRSDNTGPHSNTIHSMAENDSKQLAATAEGISILSDEGIVPVASKVLAEINDRISKRPASLIQYNSKRQKFSKRINLANSNEHVAAVCDFTGAVVAITFPAIPGRVFSYSSPLADLRNARGLAQEGKDYLRKLDVQSTAAVLITLADDYSLFRYQPSDSGAQKNAILRTVAKDILIDAILFVEEFINSNNCNWIPKLSLILTEEISQGGIQHRMSEWLKVSLEAVYKPDEESYEESVTRTSKEIKQYSHRPVTTAATKRAAIALQKDFRQWKKESRDIIISMASASVISPKLKGFLLTIVADQNLMLADEAMIDLICERLKQLKVAEAIILAEKISYFRSKLRDSEESEFAKPADSFADLPVGVYVDSTEKAEDNEFADATTPVAVEAKPAAPTLSFKERIALLKAQQAATVTHNKTENDDAPF